MRAKLALVVGLGVGYVLGTRAGRGRYEQIHDGWDQFTSSEPVQRAVEAAKSGTEDPASVQPPGLSADQVKERLARTGSVTDTFHSHPPEEIIKERM